MERLLERVQLPEAGLGGMTIRNGTLLATMAGEPVPRRFDNVSMTLRFSPDYKNMTVDLSGSCRPERQDSPVLVAQFCLP